MGGGDGDDAQDRRDLASGKKLTENVNDKRGARSSRWRPNGAIWERCFIARQSGIKVQYGHGSKSRSLVLEGGFFFTYMNIAESIHL